VNCIAEEAAKKSQIPGKLLPLAYPKQERKALRPLNLPMNHREEVKKVAQAEEEKAVAHVLK